MPFRFPCHPDAALDPGARGWKGIGLDPEQGVTRLQARCPRCATHYNAFQRTYGDETTVEWIRLRPFAVSATPVTRPEAPLWQDAAEPLGAVAYDVPDAAGRRAAREQAPTEGRWADATQLLTMVQPLVAQGERLAEPGELLLESRRPWVANDRRLALLWSTTAGRAVVAWHSFARLPDS